MNEYYDAIELQDFEDHWRPVFGTSRAPGAPRNDWVKLVDYLEPVSSTCAPHNG